MVTAISTTFLYFYANVDHKRPFIKQDVDKSSSVRLVTDDNWIKTVCFISWYTSVATNFTEAIILEVGLSGIW